MCFLRSMVRRALVALLHTIPLVLPAQTSLSGFVRDSLSGKPLGGATIQLVLSATPWAAGRMVRSDSIGRYRIDTVSPGQYLIGFQHPRLDSLGLDAVNRSIEVVKGIAYQRLDLALPSGRTFVTTLCGERPDSSGAVIGRVFNADDGSPIDSGSVVVRFAQMRVDNGGVRRVQSQVQAPFGSDGRYVACGVPVDAPVLVQARTGTSETPGTRSVSGEIELAFAPKVPLLHRDILIATRAADVTTGAAPAARAPLARTGTSRLAGRVLGADGAPVQGARVSVQDTDASATSDSTGAFRVIGLPSGTRTVEVIAIGYAPVRTAADLRPNRETPLTVSIGSKVTTLTSVKVSSTTDRSGFVTRRGTGSGYFLDARQIEARGAMNVASALTTVPSLRNNGFDTANPTRPRISGRNNCTPAAYLDGMPVRDGLGGIDDLLAIRRVGGIEVYANAAEAPAQFRGAGNCAVVLVWTTAYVP
ncbi:MAG: carboxypeptidase regulatory-like domain-containing protein [Gemmatimonadaceae bacterium]|nr:carboxypeptidase regulatory-like domain-containing protein [Gemmatimonadaceae bacterium]